MISKYLISISGGEPKSHNISIGIQLIIGAAFAGYTVTHMPEQFLKIFEHPLMQFLVYFVLFKQTQVDRTIPYYFAMFDALLFTIIINIIIYIFKKMTIKEE